jgi:hypothetical protein
MKKNILLLLCLSIFLAVPNPAVSDCVDFARVTSWYVQDEKTIIFYIRNNPVAEVVLQDCSVLSSSKIRFLKTYICDEDSLIIDGKKCAILSLTSTSGGSL